MSLSITELLQILSTFTSFDELEAWATSQANVDEIRAAAFASLAELRQYNDANEWSKVVLICELLGVIGWGDREQLDAIASYNGDCWETKLINERREMKLRHARWKKRKAGWLIFNPEYLRSKDLPEYEDEDWKVYAGIEFPVVAIDSLASQRNPRQLMPFHFGMIGGSSDFSEMVDKLRNQMIESLYSHMRPALYGRALEAFYLTIHTPFLDQDWPSGIKGGRYRIKQRDFSAELKIGSDKESCSSMELREWMADQLLNAIQVFRGKIQKKDSEYRIMEFIADADSAMDEFKGIQQGAQPGAFGAG